MNARLSREMDVKMNIMQTQISRANNFSMSERTIPEIQNKVEKLPLNLHSTEPATSLIEDGIENVWKNANMKLQRRTLGPRVT